MKKIIIPIFGIAILSLFNSCSDDFLDVNKNVNQAYNDQLTPKDRLSAAESVVFRTQANTMNRFGNLMMNAWAGNIYYYASPFADEFNMRADSQFYDEIWDNLYLGVANYQAIIDSPMATQYPHHVAVAKIMKAYYMQMIVDLYNNVPYTEAFKGQDNKNPKYDRGQDVYKGLLAELNQALALIKQTPAGTPYNLLANEDPIFAATSSNMDNWRKMANTVKLKMLVRLSNCTDAEVITWRNSELQTLAPLTTAPDTNFISEDVKINPGYTTASADQRNPLYQAFGRIDIDANDINPNYRLVVGSDYIINSLKGATTQTANVIDGRIQRLFVAKGFGGATTAITAYKGQPQGGGKDASSVEGDFATLGQFMFYSSANATVPGYVLTLSEVRFLQSEAALVYPATMSFNAQTSFNQGITASFVTLSVPSTSQYPASAYLTAIASKPGIGWSASTNKIEAIQYQKWIALTNINPTETYISHNKTGYPVLPMPQGAYYSSRPKRLMYPQSEYISNTANVPNPNIDDMYQINQYSPFWMK